MNKNEQEIYLEILKEELVPALGCTEPIAVAYASALARETLGCFPKEIVAACSGNIVKNVKGVIVPMTGDLRGIDASAILGAVGGDASRKLEVLSSVTEEDIVKTRELIGTGFCKTEFLQGTSNLHIIITVKNGSDYALVELKDSHTNVVRIEKNGEILFEKKRNDESIPEMIARGCLSIDGILDYADMVDIGDIKFILDRQIEYNTRISEEGLAKRYGANVGATLLENYGTDIKNLARAYPAAGSDARMSGCTLPVVINSGSGNQGMTVSLPVIQYARHFRVERERLYRALVVSNLVAIYQKSGIGKLSAYCGAVSAACGCGAGIAYLLKADRTSIYDTITNTLANVSGIVCDGAKPSCAAKIASSVDAAILGFCMAQKRRVFHAGEGLVKETVEKTISSIGRLGREGMRDTDIEILKIMLD